MCDQRAETLAVAEDSLGGTSLSSASLEMDGRPGVMRDAVAAVMCEWLDLLTSNVERAVAAGEIRAETDPRDAISNIALPYKISRIRRKPLLGHRASSGPTPDEALETKERTLEGGKPANTLVRTTVSLSLQEL